MRRSGALTAALCLAGQVVVAEMVRPVLPELTEAQTMQLIEQMPPPAFQAALTDLIVQNGCVLDFTDYEQQERVLIYGMLEQLNLESAVSLAVFVAMGARIETETNAMSAQFEIDREARTATLVGLCESGE